MDANHHVFMLGVDGDLNYQDDIWLSGVPAGNKLKPGIYPNTSSQESGYGTFLYTDDAGRLWAIKNTGGQPDNTKPVNISGSSRFPPNSVLTGYPMISDNQGKLWYIGYTDAKLHPAVNGGTQLVVSPNRLVSNVFSDTKGTAWELDASSGGGRLRQLPVKVLPNQYGDKPVSSPNNYLITAYQGSYAYADTEGVLHLVMSGTDKKTEVTGLQAGKLIPDSYIVVWDGTGTPWYCSDSSCAEVESKGPAIPAGTWTYSSINEGAVLASDSDGNIWVSQGWGGAWERTASDIKTKPGQVTSYSGSETNVFTVTSSGLYTLYNFGGSISYYAKPGALADSFKNDCVAVAQMPTTGAPNGLTAIGVGAVFAGIAGLLSLVFRRAVRRL